MSLQVHHLLAEEEDPLLLQGCLDLCQPHQGPRHFQLRRHLKHGNIYVQKFLFMQCKRRMTSLKALFLAMLLLYFTLIIKTIIALSPTPLWTIGYRPFISH